MIFDVVVGNPPYKSGLYQKFFNKSVDLLKDDGHMSFVIPATMILNRKDVKGTVEKNIFLEKLQKYNVKINIISPDIFCSAAIFADIAVVLLNKVISVTEINQITYKDGTTFNDVPLSSVNQLAIDPVNYINIRKKYDSYIAKNGSLADITTQRSATESVGAYIQVIRGNVGRDDFYTIISNNAKYQVASTEKKGGQVVKCKLEQLDNVFSYLKTYVARFGLALSKADQNISRSELKTVPLVSFDCKWTDADLAKELGLTDNEVALIHSVLPDYHDLLIY